MTQTRTAYRWRTCDLDSLPDTPWLRYEIIDGELIVSTRPHLQHSEIIVHLVVLLHPVVRSLGGKVLAHPILLSKSSLTAAVQSTTSRSATSMNAPGLRSTGSRIALCDGLRSGDLRVSTQPQCPIAMATP